MYILYKSTASSGQTFVLVLDDDAHKVYLHTRSYFFCIRYIGPTEVTSHIKAKKFKYKKLPHEKKNKQAGAELGLSPG